MGERLTDAELRAAAASRPGYATYPDYAPTGPERLAPYWRGPVHEEPGAALPPPQPVGFLGFTRPLSADEAEALKRSVTEKLAEGLRLAVLPPSPVFEFQPHRSPGRPWWRRRWSWAVMPAKGSTAWGYCWTAAGARRRTAREARRAASRG